MTWSDEPRATPAAGWYADPAGTGGLRYWDGATWTGYVTAPRPPGTASALPPNPSLAAAPAPPAAPKVRTPAWVWVLLGVTFLLLASGAIAAVAVPAFHVARDAVWDQEAKTLLQDTRPTVHGIAAADGSFTALRADRLGRNDPFHGYTEGASTGPKELSVAGREDGFALALLSRSGTCWVIDTTGPLVGRDRQVRTGRLRGDRPCAATDAAALTQEDF